jgi:hypothetical protein
MSYDQLCLNNLLKINGMLKEKLSVQEKQEASLMLEKYRAKYMCTVGPAIADIIKKALSSDEGRKQFIYSVEHLFNFVYFKDKSNEGLPHSTREILGYAIWQSPCRVLDVKPSGDGTILTAFMQGKINFSLGQSDLDKSPIEDAFFQRENGDDGDLISYTYDVENKFCNMEQTFMFIRNFWYYIETMVLFHAIKDSIPKNVETQLIKYIDLRKSLIFPFIHDGFPENHYYSKIDVQTSDELEEFYDKYLFSKTRSTQRKALLLASVIANATK